MVLPTAYLPPKEYYDVLQDAEIEVCESFPKRTLRNRALLSSPTGETVLLTIPVGKANSKQLTRDVRITYQLNWQQQHWHTIEALYRHTPYFQFFEDFLRPFYERKFEFLIDFNSELNATILDLLKHKRPSPNATLPTSYTTMWHGIIEYPWEDKCSVLEQLFNV